MKKDLPIYDIKLSDDTQGVGFISLVDEPAIGVDWIKLAKVTMMVKKAPKSIMAKKALSTLDGSGCFGCPPNGDGTRVNGEPDGRCKGDGADKGGGAKGGRSKTKSVSVDESIANNDSPLKDFEKNRCGPCGPGEKGLFMKNGKEVKGLIISENPRSVTLNTGAIKRLPFEERQKISLTHNHPISESGRFSSGGFSGADFASSAFLGIGEIRAVGIEEDGRILYKMRVKKEIDGPQSLKIKDEHHNQLRQIFSNKMSKIPYSNAIKSDLRQKLWSESIHESSIKMANKYSDIFEYSRNKLD